jgi:thiamine kinase-like enzyme|tara:strand:+ start:57 stop:893 length:837 start_codon:yes stop_codon:yes gene_type:complete
MERLKKILRNTNSKFEVHKQIADSETSETFVGKFKNIKSIFKLPKNINYEFIINEYLKNNIIEQINKKNITTKFVYLEKKTGLVIYEYFEMESSTKELINIPNLGKQLRKLHQIKNNGKTKTFEDQVNLYFSTTNTESNSKFYLESLALLNELKTDKDENVVSHNDLHLFNIMFNRRDIFFIDFEYLSINSRYCDLSKLISSLQMNETEINIFLNSYGIKNLNNNIYTKLKKWTLMNIYTEFLWANFMNRKRNNHFNEKYLNNLKKKIKQQTQQLELI